MTDSADDLERKSIAIFECIKSYKSIALACGFETLQTLYYRMSAEELAFQDMSPKQRLFYGLWKENWTLPDLSITHTRHATLASPELVQQLESYVKVLNHLYRRKDLTLEHAAYFEHHHHPLMPLVSAVLKVMAHQDMLEDCGVNTHRESPIHPLHEAEMSAVQHILDVLFKARALRNADKMQRECVRIAKNELLERLDALQHLRHYLERGTPFSASSGNRPISIIPFSVISQAIHDEQDLGQADVLEDQSVPVPTHDSDESDSISSPSTSVQDDPFGDIWEYAKLKM